MICLPSIVSITRSCPTPDPISLTLAINGCQLPPNCPISSQTLSGAALSSTVSATVCSSVFGDRRSTERSWCRASSPWSSRLRRNSRSRLTIQRQQHIDDVGVDGAAAAGRVGTTVERAFLDLQVTGIGDRLCHIEQHEVVEKHAGIGGKRRRSPVLLAIAHVPDGQAVLQALQEQRTELFIDRERRLLIPKIAYVVYARHSAVVETHVGLLGTADPIEVAGVRVQ